MTADLSTSYLGFDLAHPVVASASPLTGRLDSLHELEEAGAAAVVLPSLFEEQIEHDSTQMAELFEMTTHGFAEAPGGYLPDMDDYNTGPHDYLGLIREARRELRIPVIASLNGATAGGWTEYARQIEHAGADALELNVYLMATDPDVDGRAIESRYLEIVGRVRAAVDIPLAVKVGPFFSSFANMAVRLFDAGADALVLFNRFYQPDIDPEDLEVVPSLELSHSSDARLPLRWIAALSGRVGGEFAASSGVHEPIDVVKLLMVGAQVTMTTSALLRRGPAHLGELVAGLRDWLDEHEYRSVKELRGCMSQLNAPDPAAFERHNYMKALTTFARP